MEEVQKQFVKKGALIGLLIFVIFSLLIALVLPYTFTAKARSLLGSWLIPSEAALIIKLFVYNGIIPIVSSIGKMIGLSINYEKLAVSVIAPVGLAIALIKQIFTYAFLGVVIAWFFGRRRK